MTTQLTRSGATTNHPAQHAFVLLRTVFTVARIVVALARPAVRCAPARRSGVGS
jgi:hypothetical protein